MKISKNLSFMILLALIGCQNNTSKITFPTIPVEYPETKKGDVVEDYHGTQVADPYRWLEDDHSEETKEWVESQNEVTFNYLEQIPFRNDIKTRLESLWNYEKFSSPFRKGDYYYYFKNDGLQNQSVLYQTSSIEEEGHVFFDPNTLSEDGTTSLAGFAFSKDNQYFAYLISEGGSDWRTAKVMTVEDKSLLEDELKWIKFSGISWEGNGFYYSRYPAVEGQSELSVKNEYHSVYYHRLGTEQSEDQLIYKDQDHPQRNVYAQTSEDEHFLIMNVSESTSGNALYIKDLRSKGPIKEVVSTFDSDYSFLGNEGDELLFVTNNEAPRQKIISIHIDKVEKSNWKTLVPESDDVLRSASIVGGKLFASYMHNASSKINVFDLNGKFQNEVQLPGIGNSGGVSGRKEDKIGFLSFTSFTVPNSIYTINTETLETELFRAPEVDFDPSEFKTEQIWYRSKDGTQIPMFITMKKDLPLDGNNPTLLYGYGGFDIPLLPSFNLSRIPLLEAGGIYVVANIRGGGEFGKDWHKSGTKEQKQNVFDDFINAAEFLIANKYTSSEKLAIQGGSNGGLLVGACMTQRPDLFAVALPAVGVLDMLRYHQFTIGWAWAGDYGKSDEPDAFNYLYAYSPLHNIKQVSYPATLVTTADHDDRVVPAHSFKFISELQDKHQGDDPVLIRIETSAGHGAGKPTDKQIEEAADILSFIFYNTESPYPNS